MKKSISIIQALAIFKMDHPDYKIIRLKEFKEITKEKLNKHKQARLDKIIELRKLGLSLRKIGKRVSLSHEQVNNLLKQYEEI